MQTLPSESRISLMPYSGLVKRAIASSRTIAETGTLMARQRRFVIFCLKHGINDFFMPDTHQTDKNYLLACYTASLSNHETLLCRSI